jgi:hypothetical protein
MPFASIPVSVKLADLAGAGNAVNDAELLTAFAEVTAAANCTELGKLATIKANVKTLYKSLNDDFVVLISVSNLLMARETMRDL